MTISSTSVAGTPVVGGSPAGLCRLSVRAPDSSFDLAVPTDIQIADLLPAVVGYAGADLDESALKHGGWILQRLGEAPLAASGTADSLGLHDGEVLYLRPHRDAMPAVHFDDLVHGVMSSLYRRADSWRPELTRWLLLGTVLAALAVGIGVLLLPGPDGPRAAVSLLAAVVLLAGAMALSRAIGDGRDGVLLAGAATAYVVLAACLVPAGAGTDGLHARLLAAGAVTIGAAALGYAAVGVGAPFFLCCGTAGLLTGTGGALYRSTPVHTAGLIAVLVVLLGMFVPGWAFWLSGLRLPPLPANAEQLQEGIDPHPSEHVLARTAIADGYLTGLLAALGLVYAGCLVVLVTVSPSRTDLILTGALSLLAVLHGRTLGATWHRLAVVVPGLLGAGLLIARFAVVSPAGQRLGVAVGLLALAGFLLAAAATIPGRRMVPHWARAAEVAHTLVAVSLVPLLLLSLGFYHYLRGLGG